MAIYTASSPPHEASSGTDEKAELGLTQHIEAGVMTPPGEQYGEGKLTKETILAYIVCLCGCEILFSSH